MSRLRRLLKSLLPGSLRGLAKRGLFHLRNRGFEPYVSSVSFEDTRFQFFVGDRVGEQWHRDGWDWIEIGFLRDKLVVPGDVVLEAGAHHGEMTLFLSHWVGPTGQVITFEPVPRNVDIIRTNVSLNSLDNVTVAHKAVGAAPGQVRMTDESNAQVADAGPGFEVEVVALDAYAGYAPTLLKIDVEGFEAEVLKGAQKILKTRPKLALEIHAPSLDRYGTSVAELMDLLGADDYDLWIQPSGGKGVTPYHGAPIREVAHLFGLPKSRA